MNEHRKFKEVVNTPTTKLGKILETSSSWAAVIHGKSV